GISLWLSADQKWLALIMLLGAAGLITYQLWLNDFYWRRSMGSAPP
ncbi:MAG: putative negative regulator of RcsB-dependent stress response, partial [Myxococcota bacterium]